MTFLREIDYNILNSNASSEKILELRQYCHFQKYKELLIKQLKFMKKCSNFILNIKKIIKIIKTIIIKICGNLDIISFVFSTVYRKNEVDVDLFKYFIKVYKVTYSFLDIVYSSVLGIFLNPIKNIYKNGTYTIKNGLFLEDRYKYIILYIILYVLYAVYCMMLYDNYKDLFIITQIIIATLSVIFNALDDIFCFKNKILDKFYQ